MTGVQTCALPISIFSASIDTPLAKAYATLGAHNRIPSLWLYGANDFIFAALDSEQLRQVRAALGMTLPAYGTSSVNPGRGEGISVAELDGVHMLDLPWQVQPDHPAAMAYPRRALDPSTSPAPDMDRLYALGIDARNSTGPATSSGLASRRSGVAAISDSRNDSLVLRVPCVG